MIENKSWPDTVNGVTNLSGPYFEKFPDQVTEITGKLINSENFWFKHIAILFQPKYKNNPDFELLSKNIKLTADENEFLICKATGLALRQYSEFNPEAAKTFVNQNKISTFVKK